MRTDEMLKVEELRAEVGRLTEECVASMSEIAIGRAEVERLRTAVQAVRAWAEDEQRERHKAEEDRMNARSEIELLRAAALTFLNEQTDEHAAALRAVLELKL